MQQGLVEALRPDGALTWELCDPSRRNPIGPAALDWITDRCQHLRGEVIIVRGAGEVFCAGFDLESLAAPNSGEPPDQPLQRATAAMAAANATFIAAVGGHAIGAGVELACACDLRLARAGSRFQIPAAKLGVIYRTDGLARIQKVFGAATTLRMVLLGEAVDDVTAAHLGAVTRVEADAFEETLCRWVATLGATPPTVLAAHRELLRTLGAGGLDAVDRERRELHEERRRVAFAQVAQDLGKRPKATVAAQGTAVRTDSASASPSSVPRGSSADSNAKAGPTPTPGPESAAATDSPMPTDSTPKPA